MANNPWDFNASEIAPSKSAKRFEAGSPNTLGQVALHASLELLLGVGMPEVSSCIMRNTEFLNKELARLPHLETTSPSKPQRRSGIVCFRHRELAARKLFGFLTDAGISTAIRGDFIRVSPHFYQDESDLGGLIAELEKL